MTNVKNIGKEILGKSLGSFHRKTGVNNLEKNNELQTKVLQGVYSQVDNNYIEKTEESNVIHLEGSGDGVVEVVGVEGNSLVNLFDNSVVFTSTTLLSSGYIQFNTAETYDHLISRGEILYKPSTKYTLVFDTINNTYVNNVRINSSSRAVFIGGGEVIKAKTNGRSIIVLETKSNFTDALYDLWIWHEKTGNGNFQSKIMILEGDWTNKEIPPHFEGMQSCFEEKVNEQGLNQIEILLKNINHMDNNKIKLDKLSAWRSSTTVSVDNGIIKGNNGANTDRNCSIKINIPTIYIDNTPEIYLSCLARVTSGSCNLDYTYAMTSKDGNNSGASNVTSDIIDTQWKRVTKVCRHLNEMKQKQSIYTMFGTTNLPPNATLELKDVVVSYKEPKMYVPHKLNKIQLQLNEPLRGLPNGVKDRLCVKDGKLVVERKCDIIIFDGSEDGWTKVNSPQFTNSPFLHFAIKVSNNIGYNACVLLCNQFIWEHSFNHIEYIWRNNSHINIVILNSKLSTNDDIGLKLWLTQNITTIIYPLPEPFYEEVLNEYGEPILLEGYENGTLYIDSVITPTATIKYTPKMQAYKDIKIVTGNNALLGSDINESIIPYMMEVDMMILEKELGLNIIQIMEVLDMTSMQERTYKMLARLIEGKSLTEQECKDRVVIYLDAGKITAKHAEDLMLLIAEKYQ